MKVRIGRQDRHFRTVTFDPRQNEVLLIEQRLLPHEFKVAPFRTYRETARAISDMVVRGAGAIGATAAYGLAQAALAFRGRGLERFRKHVQQALATLKAARPTAVDPVNAMMEVMACCERGEAVDESQELAVQAAQRFAEGNVEECRALGEHGAHLIGAGARVLTHCNAGWLAFVDVGSATAPMYVAQEQGREFHVFCDETRPRCQGATLTAWEMAQQRISHEVIADNAAGHLMQRGEIDLVIVGSDRVLGRTGEAANKIGTYTKAVLAKRHSIPFYVAMPRSTLDWETASGLDIPIEERSQEEVLGAWGISRGERRFVRVANPSSRARNIGFDVTPSELITGFITPLGILKPRQLGKLR